MARPFMLSVSVMNMAERQTPGRWAFCAVLAFVFLSFFLVPARVVSMRHRLERQLPEQWASVTNNGPFRAVLPYSDLGFSDEGLYAARTRQIYLHGRPYGPWLGGRSLRSWIFDCLMFYPIAFFIWLCGGNFSLGWTLTHAVIGSGWFSMLYFLFRAYSREERYSLVASAFVFFFLDTLRESVMLVFGLFQDPAAVVSRLSYLPSTLFIPISLYMRLPEPGLVFLWLAGGLAGAAVLGLSPKRRPLAAVAVGAFSGLLCLVHFFDWVICVLTLALLAAASRWDRDSEESSRFNSSVVAVAAAAVSSVYYLFATHMTKDYMRDLIDRSGVWGRRFHPISIPYLLFAYLFWRLAERRQGLRRRIWMTAVALEMAAFILANLSLALGYELMFPEHSTHFAAFAAIVAASCWVLEQEGLKSRLKPHALLLTAFFCAWVTFQSKAWADLHFKLYGIPKDVAAAGEWMNANVPKGSPLLALSAPINYLLPSETDMRWLVTLGCSVCGEPFKTEDNLRGFALILKTMDVDTARFRDERWQLGEKIWRARGAEENLTGNLNWEAIERGNWMLFLLEETAWREQDRVASWNRIIDYVQETKPLRSAFYVWVQKGDEAFLRRTPASRGGSLIYSNPSVSLYAFANGVSPKAL